MQNAYRIVDWRKFYEVTGKGKMASEKTADEDLRKTALTIYPLHGPRAFAGAIISKDDKEGICPGLDDGDGLFWIFRQALRAGSGSGSQV